MKYAVMIVFSNSRGTTSKVINFPTEESAKNCILKFKNDSNILTYLIALE